MNLQICTRTFALLLITIIAATLCIVTYIACNAYTERVTAAMTNGYDEVTTAGTNQLVWQKKH